MNSGPLDHRHVDSSRQLKFNTPNQTAHLPSRPGSTHDLFISGNQNPFLTIAQAPTLEPPLTFLFCVPCKATSSADLFKSIKQYVYNWTTIHQLHH